jgi:hypothetical protein
MKRIIDPTAHTSAAATPHGIQLIVRPENAIKF